MEKETSRAPPNDDALVHLIYRCSTDASLWPELLRELERRDWRSPPLAMHLEQSVRMQQALYAREGEVMEYLPMGIAYVEGGVGMRLVGCNRAFRAMASSFAECFSARGEGFEIRHAGLCRIVREVRRRTTDTRHMLLPGAPPVSIQLHRLPCGRLMLFTSSQKAAEHLRYDSLHALFGLTRAEARLVRCLCNGSANTVEAAKACGISAHTARSQLKSVFAKVGVGSQLDLVKKILTSVAVLAHPGEAERREVLTLPDGRRLCYSEYGDPHGVPVLHFLSLGMSCHHFHPELRALADEGLRLITPERPGIGHSDPKAGYTAADIAEDMRHLLNHLGVRSCACLGYASGGLYALSFAALHPRRVRALSLVASLLPNDFSRDFAEPFGRVFLRQIAQQAPTLHAQLARLLLRHIEQHPESFFLEHMRKACAADRLAAHVALRRMAHRSFCQAVSVSPDGVIEDLRCTGAALRIDPGVLRMPCVLWHGHSDQVVRAEGSRRFADLLPQGEYREVAGGHLIFYTHWKEILARVRSLAA